MMDDDAMSEQPLERASDAPARGMSKEALRVAASQAGVFAAVFAVCYTRDHREQLEQLSFLKRSEMLAYAVCFHLVGHGLLVPAIPTAMAEAFRALSDEAADAGLALPALDELPEHVRADMDRVLAVALDQQRFIDEKLGNSVRAAASDGPRGQAAGQG